MATENKPDDSPNPNDDLPFDKMILACIKRREDEAEKGEKKRIPLCVTLHYRYMNDHASYWDTEGGWTTVPGGGLMTWPIIGRVVWANTSNWLATKIGLDIEVPNSDPFIKGGEIVCQALYPYWKNHFWTDQNTSLMSLYSQLYCNWFAYSCTSKDEGIVKIPESGQDKIEAADPQFACRNCGAGGPATDMAKETPADLSGPQECPQCKEKTAYLDEPSDGEHDVDVISGYRPAPKIKNTLEVIPSFLIRADELNSRAGDFSKAHWFFYYSTHRRYELKATYGSAAAKLSADDGKKWTDGVKWWHALQTSTAVLSYQEPGKDGTTQNKDDDLLQAGRHWFVKGVVSNWKSPEDYEFDSDKCKFNIKKGETVEQAFKRLGKPYKGLFIIASGKSILWIGSQDHNDYWSAGLWLMNGASAWGKPQQELLDIQEALNSFFSMFIEHGMRSSMPHLILDGNMLDHNNLKNRAGNVTYTKKGMPRTHPINWYWSRIEPARLSGDLVEIWALMKEGVDEISGVSKASVGQADTRNETMGGQALLTQRSMGLLIPSQKSEGAGQKMSFKQFLRAVQLYWTDDQIKTVLAQQNKAWDELNLEAFRELDIRTTDGGDLTVSVTEGTDVPVTYFEREQRMMQTIVSGVLWNPDIPVELRQQIAKFAGVDFDPGNVEAERRHQAEVLRKMKAACEFGDKEGIAYVYTPETGVKVNPQFIEKAMTMPGCEILPDTENIEFAIQFFNAHLLAAHTAEQPDQLYIAMLEKRVQTLQIIGMQKAAAMQQQQAAIAAKARGIDPERETVEADKDRMTKIQLARDQQAHDLQTQDSKQGHERQLLLDKQGGEEQSRMTDKVPSDIAA